MAYIGSSQVANIFTSARPRDEYIGDGFQYAFPVSQEVPGGFESNITPVVDNVVQEPATAYTIKDKIRITRSNTQHFPVWTLIPYQSYIGAAGVLVRTFSQAWDYTIASVAAGAASHVRQILLSDGSVINEGEVIVKPTADHEGVVLINVVNSTFVEQQGALPNNGTHALQMKVGGQWYFVGSDDLQRATSDDGEIWLLNEAHVEIKEPEVNMRLEQANGAQGIVVAVNSNFIDLISTTDQALTPSGGTVLYRRPYKVDYEAAGVDISYQAYTMGSFDVDTVDTFRYHLVAFTGVPEVNQVIYMRHDGGSTFQAAPTAGSVDETALADNLKQFTVDKFTSTLNQTDFQLSKTPASITAIQVFVNGQLKTDTVDYVLTQPDVVRLTLALAAGVQVTIVHLGFGTVSRYAGVDGSVRTETLADNAVTAIKLADDAVEGRHISSTAITDAIGGTAIISEANGLQVIENSLSIEGQLRLTDGLNDNGQIVFPATPNPSINPNTLDDYEEGDYQPVVEFGGANQSLVATTDGEYTKIGDLVSFNLSVSITNIGTSTGAISITLPFACRRDNVVSVLPAGFNTGVTDINGMTIAGSNEVTLTKSNGSGGYSTITDADVVGGTTTFMITGQYKVA